MLGVVVLDDAQVIGIVSHTLTILYERTIVNCFVAIPSLPYFHA